MPLRATEDAPGMARRLRLNPALLARPLLDPAVPSGCFEDGVQSRDRAQQPRGGAEKISRRSFVLRIRDTAALGLITLEQQASAPPSSLFFAFLWKNKSGNVSGKDISSWVSSAGFPQATLLLRADHVNADPKRIPVGSPPSSSDRTPVGQRQSRGGGDGKLASAHALSRHVRGTLQGHSGD
ncbi:unnamed protein product [Rangifer tarandus platyrhynchus]|uniref:Uncharacterized protein n=1 Tax=Rangifer tarandus platyrhynchus TaxID=3082113 RepID=A0ACB1MJZ9_RANTA